MSRPDDRPVDLRRALASHGLHAARHVLTWLPARGTARDVAFRHYFAEVGARFRREPVAFRVTDVRPVATGPGHRIVEIALAVPGLPDAARPGDMVALTWHNSPGRVAEAVAGAPAPVPHWTTPRPCRPARRVTTDATAFYRDVLDLSLPLPAGDHARTAPRIVPRVYTLAGVEPARPGAPVETRVSLLVSHRDDWPDRAAAFLTRRRPGDEVRGWVLPHPSRLPALHGAVGPGVAVVTGSGLAGVLAALRAGALAEPLQLVWGTRHEVEPWLLTELEGYAAGGTIDRLELVRSRGPRPRRVADVLDPAGLRERLGHGWVYVSGHTAMGAPVRERMVSALGAATVGRMVAELRYVEST